MNTKTISFRKIMILSSFVLTAVLFAYIMLMYVFVSNTKKLSQLESDIIFIQSQITQTEQELISMRRSVNKTTALEQGYVSPVEVAYIKVDGIKTAFLNE